eukprot:COSAG06_NODE_946_length_11363_cov_6.766602_10_plen_120_part_00
MQATEEFKAYVVGLRDDDADADVDAADGGGDGSGGGAEMDTEAAAAAAADAAVRLRSWAAEGVAEWLSSTLNLPGVADAVLAKGVDGETAAAMDKADWAELGASCIESAKIWAKLQSMP